MNWESLCPLRGSIEIRRRFPPNFRKELLPDALRWIQRIENGGAAMINEYLDVALKTAKYEILGDGSHYAEIPEMPGVWAAAESQEACRFQLREVAEEWMLLGYWFHKPLPVFGDIDPNLKMGLDTDDETPRPHLQAEIVGISGTYPRAETSLHDKG